jgi:hypothetical protein
MRVHLHEVGGTEIVHHRLHTVGLIEVRADIKLLRVAGRAEQRGQVPARRATPRGEAVRIEPILRGVRPEPADGGFAVLNLRRRFRELAEPVVD